MKNKTYLPVSVVELKCNIFTLSKRQQDTGGNNNVDKGSRASGSGKNNSKELEEIYLKIASDVALFRTRNCSSSSITYESEEDFSKCPSQHSKIFEATKIHKPPLATARSMAHSNKMDIKGNEIQVKLLDSDSSRSSSDFICRICHGGESFDDLLTPCRCRGTVALVHLKCLERWLKESNHSSCELCQHHYKIIREPKYSIPRSILVFLRHPGEHWKELALDLLAFSVYTPSAVASTYLLMMICESLVKSNIVVAGTLSSHLVAFSAVFGMAAIDFTYSSWLLVTLQRHIEAWRDWYRTTQILKVVLPRIKMRPHRKKKIKQEPKEKPKKKLKCKIPIKSINK